MTDPVAAEAVAAPPRAPWEVARDLQWKIASGVLLDPMTWLGVLIAAWALRRTAVLGSEAALLALLALATLQADELLFRRRAGDLLRVMPLGETGFLKLCRAELGWWMHPARILAAAAASSDGGWTAAVAVWLAGALVAPLGLRLALVARSRLGRRGATLLWIPAVAAVLLPLPWSWEAAALFAVLGLLAGLGLDAAFLRLHPKAASDAVTAPPAPRGTLARALSSLASPLPAPVRARVVRDVLLLLRGDDPQGLLLLLLAPLSCLFLVDELATMPSRDALAWRVLTATALGGAAVAYATGPGIHRARNRAMSWERGAPRPGRRATAGALAWSLSFALLHGGATLLTVALAQQGRFVADLPGLVLPVLGLEAAMAHFVVVFVMGATQGRRVAGEGTLALSLPVVAVVVAVVGMLFAPAVLLYFVVTAGMVTAGVDRYDAVEVTW